MKMFVKIKFVRDACAGIAALVCILMIAGGLGVLAASANSAPARGAVSLDGVSLGAGVGTVVQALGAPGLVQTTDGGHEWRWYDAAGLDVDLLTDDSLVVRKVLVSRPEPMDGKPAKLVQPGEFPLLEAKADEAASRMKAAGAIRQSEPEGTISAWSLGEDLVVFELQNKMVRKILALDRMSAARSGYLGVPPQSESFRSPRLIRQFAVDYPKRAIAQRAQGVVVVRADISKTGEVKEVRVVVSSGNPDIDAAEVTSLRRSAFRPARCGDEPCDGVFLDREEYTLDNP